MTGADFLQLSPGAAPVRGLTGWLADAIRAAIMDGRLRAGTPLPATRLLAGDLGVPRGVIVEAYQRLADEGLVSARPGAGTRVLGVSRPAPAAAGPPPPGPLLVPPGWRERADIDLSPGVPDLSGFPRAAWIRAERAVLEQASVSELGYGDPRGSLSLRTELAGWLARTRGLRADPGDIIVVTGVAQALALLAQVLQARGLGEIAVEDPGSRGARDDLAYWSGLPKRDCREPPDAPGFSSSCRCASTVRRSSPMKRSPRRSRPRPGARRWRRCSRTSATGAAPTG